MSDVVAVLEHLQASGWAAWGWYALLFVIANVLFVPASGLCLVGGFWLGFWPAALVTAIARPTAAVVGYGLARGVLRAWVAQRLTRRPRLLALDRALAAGGLRVVILLRLSPVIPSTLSNYVLGASRVMLTDFVLGSGLGTLPSTVLYTYVGSGLHATVALLSGTRTRHPGEYALMAVGLLATTALVWLLMVRARRELESLLAEQDRPPPDASHPQDHGAQKP